MMEDSETFVSTLVLLGPMTGRFWTVFSIFPLFTFLTKYDDTKFEGSPIDSTMEDIVRSTDP
jgi:hypothetical protein